MGATPIADWQKRFEAELKSKGVGPCIKCRHPTISVGGHPLTFVRWRDGMTRHEEGHLMAMTVCNRCGHADFYSLQVLGLQHDP